MIKFSLTQNNNLSFWKKLKLLEKRLPLKAPQRFELVEKHLKRSRISAATSDFKSFSSPIRSEYRTKETRRKHSQRTTSESNDDTSSSKVFGKKVKINTLSCYNLLHISECCTSGELFLSAHFSCLMYVAFETKNWVRDETKLCAEHHWRFTRQLINGFPVLHRDHIGNGKDAF